MALEHKLRPTIFTRIKCALGRHTISDLDKQKLRSHPDEPLEAVCAIEGCMSKVRLNLDVDKKHFFINEV